MKDDELVRVRYQKPHEKKWSSVSVDHRMFVLFTQKMQGVDEAKRAIREMAEGLYRQQKSSSAGISRLVQRQILEQLIADAREE